MFRKLERKKVFNTYCLAAAPKNADEVKMDTQKGSGARDTSGTFSRVTTPI